MCKLGENTYNAEMGGNFAVCTVYVYTQCKNCLKYRCVYWCLEMTVHHFALKSTIPKTLLVVLRFCNKGRWDVLSSMNTHNEKIWVLSLCVPGVYLWMHTYNGKNAFLTFCVWFFIHTMGKWLKIPLCVRVEIHTTRKWVKILLCVLFGMLAACMSNLLLPSLCLSTATLWAIGV